MIYLDHHSTNPVLPEAWQAMLPFLTESFGNPSSAHSVGRKARQALEDARERIAALLGAHPEEIIFTSGATEANNLALFGLAGDLPGHILASPIEHPCVIEPLKQLARRGFDVEWLDVQQTGVVAVEEAQSRLRPDTRLITLMMVNHETGAIQPVAESARLSSNVRFHTDAAQAVGKLPISGFHELGVTSMSVSGHKFGAPKGIGLLLLKRGVTLRPMMFGGHQQQGRRPGTEPVALAAGLAKALEISCGRIEQTCSHVLKLRTGFLSTLREQVPLVVNSPEIGSPYVVNVSFPGCRTDLMLMKLDLAGIACSTGSACSSGSLQPSPVLQAMNIPDEILRSAMRFSFGPDLTLAEIGDATQRIIKCAEELRRENL